METERLTFRPYTIDDIDFYTSLWSDPEVVKYIGKGLIKSKKEAERSLKEWIIPAYRDGLGLYLIQRKGSGEGIGHAGLVKQVVDGQNEIEMGYWLAHPYWGMGYASEAAGFFINYGREKLQKNRLVSLIHPKNAASIAVAKKAGMLYEKTVFFNGNRTRVYVADE